MGIILVDPFGPPPLSTGGDPYGVFNVIRYIGTRNLPQDIRRRRQSALETMRRMGTPCVVKHMYNAQDVEDGIAMPSPGFDRVYGQSRNKDPLSYGIGYVSTELSPDEWYDPATGAIIKSKLSPGAGYVVAPKYRGFGPGYLIYVIQPDVADDLFKVGPEGVFIRVQQATVQAPWFPEMNDNDLFINVEIDRSENIAATKERFQLKMTSPTTMRQHDTRGRRELPNLDAGNRFIIGQAFEMTLIPSNNILYSVDIDR